MINFNDTVDLIRRRTNGCLGPDGVDTVYIQFDSEERNKGSIIVVMKDDMPPMALTQFAVRYNHLFEDHLDTYGVRVLQATNYFKKDSNTYEVWVYSKGFDI